MSNFYKQSKIKTVSYRFGVIIALIITTVTYGWAFNRQTPVVQAVSKVGPAVVNISSEYMVQNRRHPFGGNPFFDNFSRR